MASYKLPWNEDAIITDKKNGLDKARKHGKKIWYDGEEMTIQLSLNPIDEEPPDYILETADHEHIKVNLLNTKLSYFEPGTLRPNFFDDKDEEEEEEEQEEYLVDEDDKDEEYTPPSQSLFVPPLKTPKKSSKKKKKVVKKTKIEKELQPKTSPIIISGSASFSIPAVNSSVPGSTCPVLLKQIEAEEERTKDLLAEINLYNQFFGADMFQDLEEKAILQLRQITQSGFKSQKSTTIKTTPFSNSSTSTTTKKKTRLNKKTNSSSSSSSSVTRFTPVIYNNKKNNNNKHKNDNNKYSKKSNSLSNTTSKNSSSSSSLQRPQIRIKKEKYRTNDEEKELEEEKENFGRPEQQPQKIRPILKLKKRKIRSNKPSTPKKKRIKREHVKSFSDDSENELQENNEKSETEKNIIKLLDNPAQINQQLYLTFNCLSCHGIYTSVVDRKSETVTHTCNNGGNLEDVVQKIRPKHKKANIKPLQIAIV